MCSYKPHNKNDKIILVQIILGPGSHYPHPAQMFSDSVLQVKIKTSI